MNSLLLIEADGSITGTAMEMGVAIVVGMVVTTCIAQCEFHRSRRIRNAVDDATVFEAPQGAIDRYTVGWMKLLFDGAAIHSHLGTGK